MTNATRTIPREAPWRWGRGIGRAILFTGALAGMALGTVAHAQISFRNAASSSALPPQFRAADSAVSAVLFVGAGAQVARETAGSITPVIPTGTQASDFAVLIIAGRPADTSEPAAPAGWTLRSSSLREVGTNDLKIMTFYRVLTGGDANPSITLPASWVGTDTRGMSGQIAVWRGVDTTTPFDVADVTGNDGNGNEFWTPPSITTVTDGATAVSAVASSDNNQLGFDTAQGFTLRMSGTAYDTFTGGDHAIGLADKVQATAGAVTMPNWEQLNNNDDYWAGITFALRPNNAPLTINVPGGTLQNDVMIASVGVRPSSTTITAPAGWTLVRRIDNGAANTNSLAVYRKVAGASEPASYTWSFSGATLAVGGIQSFLNIDTTNPIDVESTGQATPSATTHATQSVTTTVDNAIIVTSHSYASSRTWTPPAGMTESFDQPSGADSINGQSIEGSYVVQSAAGATGVQTATAAGDADAGNAHILALRPASPGLTINKPSGTVASDVMIASIGVRPSSSTITPPAGWTLLRRMDNTTGTTNSLAIYLKVAGGAEPASYTWAVGGFTDAVGGIQSFSGVDTASPIDVEDGQTTASSTSHATPSVIRTINGTMLVTSHSFASSRIWTPPAGMNEAFDVASLTPSNALGQSMDGNWLTEYAMGATGVKTATVGGDADAGNAHILALRPASPPALPGGFNAYDTSTGAGAITGVIQTRVAGNTISVDIIALDAAKTAIYTAFADTVRIEVLNASDNSGALDANSCRSSWSVIQTVSPDLTFVASDNGRETISFTQTNSYPDVRLRITYPAGAPTRTGCSTDNFAIRPDQFANLRVRDNNWETAGTARTLNDTQTSDPVFHKAGRPFTVTATAENDSGNTTTNYTGTPSTVLRDCGGDNACLSTFGTFTIGASFAAGQLVSNVATYSEVGSFELELVDSTFSSVDATDGSTAAEREIRSRRVDVGRFVPDHFAVAFNTPQFGTACGVGGFTYVGQTFSYIVQPVITVTAQNFTNDTTVNYAGALWRITNASLTPATQAARYNAATGTLDLALLPAVTADPVISAGGNGVGTLTFSTGGGIAFTRASAVAPFDADLALSLNVIDRDDVAFAGNPASFGAPTAGNGIAFSAGKGMRFGRLRLGNALGSGKVDLPVPIQTQYWSGTAFQTNSADNCTSISAANIGFSNYFGGISAANMNSANISGLGGPFVSGAGSLALTKPLPAPGSPGAVTLTVNLTAEAKLYLKGNWGVPTFTADPTSRAAFGIYGSQPDNFIFFRENY